MMQGRVSALSCVERFVLTEKSFSYNEREGKISFYVRSWAKKPVVKTALQDIFGFKVKKVWIIRIKGSTGRSKYGRFKRSDIKKAIVKIEGSFDMKGVLGG